MNRRDWLSLVAVHSDAWLMAVAFFYAVKLDSSGRARLYRQLNTLPTLFEVVTGRARPTTAPAKPVWQQQQRGGKDGGGGGGVAGGLPPRLPPLPFKEMPASAIQGGSKHPDPRGRRLEYEDITPRLQGKYTEVRAWQGRPAGRAVATGRAGVARQLWGEGSDARARAAPRRLKREADTVPLHFEPLQPPSPPSPPTHSTTCPTPPHPTGPDPTFSPSCTGLMTPCGT
jgi:hypothetical protein